MKKYINKITTVIIILCCFFNYTPVFAEAVKYPDFAYEFLGEDKYENYNRKMFNFNQRLNKYFIKPVHIIWASVAPQYVMDRILGISNNVEFPARFVSCLIQRDFKSAGHESARFLVNSTIGLGGMFDPAKHILKIEQVNENMEQALAKCHVRAKRYFVFPVLSFTTYRGLTGKVLDAALNPTTYIGTPVLAAIKATLTINRTSYAQALIKALEDNFPDPYEVYKTLYGIDSYSKLNNFDRVEVISQLSTDENIRKRKKRVKHKKYQSRLEVSANILDSAIYEDSNNTTYREEVVIITEEEAAKVKKDKKNKPKKEETAVESNVSLYDYNPQSPFTDSMRTSLFYLPESDKSIWNEMSIWNKSFKKKIKTSDINLAEGRKNYKYRYIMQKDKNAPLVIIYPSTGAGVMSNHPTMFAKLFYDAGYSALIIGNPFQWEFVQSMDENYRPGLPAKDAEMIRMATSKIINKLEKQYKREFKNKVVIGTSYGAMTALFMADMESRDNILGDTEYIAICPPVDLFYSVNVVDEAYKKLSISPDELKNLVASVAAKTFKLYQSKKEINFLVNNLPYTEEESKFLTSFLMHQKLSDVIFVIENAPTNKRSDIYEKINNIDYKEYSEKYLFVNTNKENKKLLNDSKLTHLSNYLKKGTNYRIYHSKNDYLINNYQLKQLKQLSGNRLVIIDNGAHLGFLYRPEFIQEILGLALSLNPKKEEEKL